MTRRAVAPAIVRAAEHPWIRIGVGAIAFIVAALAVAILVAQARGVHRDRIIGQLACQVQRLGGRPVDGASCPPTPPAPTPTPGVSRETSPPTIVLSPPPAERPTVVVVPAPAASSSSPRPSGSPTPSRSPSSRPRPSPTPTCTPLPMIPVCRPTPLAR